MGVDYSPSQKEVINFERGNLQVIACASSGKTDVITRRIAKLISKKIADPEEIVAFTFTEKAAEEMKFRIRQHLENLRPSNLEIGDMYVGTITSCGGLYVGSCLHLSFGSRFYSIRVEYSRPLWALIKKLIPSRIGARVGKGN